MERYNDSVKLLATVYTLSTPDEEWLFGYGSTVEATRP